LIGFEPVIESEVDVDVAVVVVVALDSDLSMAMLQVGCKMSLFETLKAYTVEDTEFKRRQVLSYFDQKEGSNRHNK